MAKCCAPGCDAPALIFYCAAHSAAKSDDERAQPPTVGGPPVDLNAWRTALGRCAEGLNLADELDRDVFRGRVRIRTAATGVARLARACRALTGETDVPTTRADTIRRIADAWILRTRGQTENGNGDGR